MVNCWGSTSGRVITNASCPGRRQPAPALPLDHLGRAALVREPAREVAHRLGREVVGEEHAAAGHEVVVGPRALAGAHGPGCPAGGRGPLACGPGGRGGRRRRLAGQQAAHPTPGGVGGGVDGLLGARARGALGLARGRLGGGLLGRSLHALEEALGGGARRQGGDGEQCGREAGDEQGAGRAGHGRVSTGVRDGGAAVGGRARRCCSDSCCGHGRAPCLADCSAAYRARG
jgi:hypothetical protein